MISPGLALGRYGHFLHLHRRSVMRSPLDALGACLQTVWGRVFLGWGMMPSGSMDCHLFNVPLVIVQVCYPCLRWIAHRQIELGIPLCFPCVCFVECFTVVVCGARILFLCLYHGDTFALVLVVHVFVRPMKSVHCISQFVDYPIFIHHGECGSRASG